MLTSDGIDPFTILHPLSSFSEDCDLEQISEIRACLIDPTVLKEKDFDNFLTYRNAQSCVGLRYWPEYINRFLSKYATTTDIQSEIMQL